VADPLQRGRLTFRQHGVGVELVPGHGIFSAATVDPGTAYLLRWLADVPGQRVLDVGCGYGPLALWLVAADPARTAVAVDRDAVALGCTATGAAVNGVADRVEVRASLGYDDLGAEERFDLVVSNVPAKVGPAALRHLLLDVWFHLAPDGLVAVVVVDRLAAAVAALLDDEAVAIESHRANRGYAAWSYRFRDQPAEAAPGSGFDRGVYRRGERRFEVGATAWAATTSYTLPEFDTLAHSTEAAVELLTARRLPAPVALVGVGQGHLAAALGPSAARLVDRDLLALRTAATNAAADVACHHVAHPVEVLAGSGAVVVALPEREPVAVTAAVLEPALVELGAGVPVVLHGRAVDVGRVLDRLGLVAGERRALRAGVAAFTVTPPAYDRRRTG
jgi:16S rRNA (guanine1207-N2)-methyltransferase